MSARIVMLCHTILVFVSFVLTQKITSGAMVTSTIPSGNCSCGGFATEQPEDGASPALSQTPGLVVKCDEEGANTCKTLCLALATATKAKGPEILCNRLVHADNLKLSAFYKICDEPWVFANMTAEEPLCCLDTKVKPCVGSGADTNGTRHGLDAVDCNQNQSQSNLTQIVA